MNKYFFVVVYFFCLFISHSTFAQKKINFGSPLTIPLILAGNYGELRSSHFHAGLDIKTNQQEGLPVLAAENGYISRIKISLGGYGKSLYITHPNGYTTVYAHLQKFDSEIEAYVKKRQYDKKSYTIELFPFQKELIVSKRQQIALSGNTGGSGGPHLHFEIRNGSGVPLNPMNFEFNFKDNLAPVISTLAIYPLNDTSTINGKHNPLLIPVLHKNGKYFIDSKTTLKGHGVLGFGVSTIDKMNGTSNKFAIHSIHLFADSTLIFEQQMEDISFAQSKFLKSHMDFNAKTHSKTVIHKSYLEPYNKLKIYKNVQSNGKVFFSKYGHNLKYSISDYNGNVSELAFTVKLDTTHAKLDTTKAFILKYAKPNSFSSKGISVTTRAFGLYHDTKFEIKKEEKPFSNSIGPVLYIGDPGIALHKPASFQIDSIQLPDSLKTKLLAGELNHKKWKIAATYPCKPSGSGITFKSKYFGYYALVFDTIAPTLKITPPKSGDSKIFVKVKDNLSGIKKWEGKIDGKWVLFEYEPKTATCFFRTDDIELTKGKHVLNFVVTDAVGNKSEKVIDFIW